MGYRESSPALCIRIMLLCYVAWSLAIDLLPLSQRCYFDIDII